MSKINIKNKFVRNATNEEIEKICTIYTDFLANDRGINPFTQKPLSPEYTDEERIDTYLDLKQNTTLILTQIELEDGFNINFFTAIDSYISQFKSLRTNKIRNHINLCYTTFQLCDNGDIIKLEEDECIIPQKSKDTYKESIESGEIFESFHEK